MRSANNRSLDILAMLTELFWLPRRVPESRALLVKSVINASGTGIRNSRSVNLAGNTGTIKHIHYRS